MDEIHTKIVQKKKNKAKTKKKEIKWKNKKINEKKKIIDGSCYTNTAYCEAEVNFLRNLIETTYSETYTRYAIGINTNDGPQQILGFNDDINSFSREDFLQWFDQFITTETVCQNPGGWVWFFFLLFLCVCFFLYSRSPVHIVLLQFPICFAFQRTQKRNFFFKWNVL